MIKQSYNKALQLPYWLRSFSGVERDDRCSYQ